MITCCRHQVNHMYIYFIQNMHHPAWKTAKMSSQSGRLDDWASLFRLALRRNFSTIRLVFGQGFNPSFDAELARARLEYLGIPLDRATSKLSGGQQAQVALVLALAKRPDLLILDEPIASLDPLARHEFQQMLVEAVAESGQTVIFSSHLVSNLEQTCDYLIILSASRVQLAGDIEQVLHTHKRLIGPHERVTALARTHQVLQSSEAERHTTLLVRTAGPVLDPAWIVQDLSLEEIILAYLARTRSSTAAPGHELKRLEAVQ